MKVNQLTIDNTIKNIDLFTPSQIIVVFDMLSEITYKSGFELHNYMRDSGVLKLLIEKSLNFNNYTEKMILKYLEIHFIKIWKEIKTEFFDLNYKKEKSRKYANQIGIYEMNNLKYNDVTIINLISKTSVDKLQDELTLRYG